MERAALAGALAVVLAASFSSTASAAIKVTISHAGTDRIGEAIQFRLQEEFAKSASFQVWQGTDGADFEIRLTSLGTDQTFGGISVYSAVAVMLKRTAVEKDFVANIVGYCGEAAAAVCASHVYESLGPAVQKYNLEAFARAGVDAVLQGTVTPPQKP